MSLDIFIWDSPVLELNIVDSDNKTPITLTPSATQEVMNLLKKNHYIPENSHVKGNCVWEGGFHTDEKAFMDKIPVGGVTLGDVLWPNDTWSDNSRLTTDMVVRILSGAIEYVNNHSEIKQGYDSTFDRLVIFKDACYNHPNGRVSLWW